MSSWLSDGDDRSSFIGKTTLWRGSGFRTTPCVSSSGPAIAQTWIRLSIFVEVWKWPRTNVSSLTWSTNMMATSSCFRLYCRLSPPRVSSWVALSVGLFRVLWLYRDITAAGRKMWDQDQKKDYHRAGLSPHAISWWETKVGCMKAEVTCLLTLKSSAWLKWTDGWMNEANVTSGSWPCCYTVHDQDTMWNMGIHWFANCFLTIRCDYIQSETCGTHLITSPVD